MQKFLAKSNAFFAKITVFFLTCFSSFTVGKCQPRKVFGKKIQATYFRYRKGICGAIVDILPAFLICHNFITVSAVVILTSHRGLAIFKLFFSTLIHVFCLHSPWTLSNCMYLGIITYTYLFCMCLGICSFVVYQCMIILI